MYKDQIPKTTREDIVNKCSELYSMYGYRRFMMNKFENYALYADNKNFLVDDRLLTFTDGGKLKALKPDITLSIVKNLAKEDRLPLKVFYDEAVYRVKKGEREFSELRQIGLELIGDDNLYATTEAICLAKASLNVIDTQNILDVSHMGILLPLIDQACEQGADRDQLINLITQKNADGLVALFEQLHISSPLAKLVGSYQPLSDMMVDLQSMLPDSDAVYQLTAVSQALKIMNLDRNVYLDFSLMHNFSYYNGIIFKGYVKNVPVAVLSGGRYDPLLEQFNLRSAAIGFAIYLDYVQQNQTQQITDVLLLYSANDDPIAVASATQVLTQQAYSVMACTHAPSNRNFEKTLTLKEVLS